MQKKIYFARFYLLTTAKGSFLRILLPFVALVKSQNSTYTPIGTSELLLVLPSQKSVPSFDRRSFAVILAIGKPEGVNTVMLAVKPMSGRL